MEMKLSLNIRKIWGLFLLLVGALIPFLIWNDGYLIAVTGMWTYYTSWDRALHFYYLFLSGFYAIVLFITGLILVMPKD